MKKLLIFVTIAFLMLQLSATSQEGSQSSSEDFAQKTMKNSPLDAVLSRYLGKDGFTTVNITPEMFSLFSDGDSKKGHKDKDFMDFLSTVSGMKIIHYGSEDKEDKSKKVEFDSKLKQEFINSVKSLITSDYVELMSVHGSDEEVVMVIKKGKTKIKEFLMYVNSDKEAVVIWINGDMDLNLLKKYSGELSKMKGMNLKMK